MAVYQSPTGTWFYRFKYQGKPYHKSIPLASTKKEAEMFETRVKSDLLQGKMDLIETKGIYPFDKLCEDFDSIYGKERKSWHKSEKYRFKGFKEYFKGKQLRDITPLAISKYRAKRIGEGAKPATVNREKDILSAVLKVAVTNGYIDENPCYKVKNLKVDNKVDRCLNQDEVIALFNNLPDYLKPIVTVLMHTGLRKGECLQLKWRENIDLKERMIILYKTKNNKIRKIPMSDTVYITLNTLPLDKEYVFINPNTGRPFTDFHKGFKEACTKAGIGKFRIHDLRHHFATTLCSKGTELLVVADILGHSDIRITAQRYAFALPENKRAAVQLMDNLTPINKPVRHLKAV